MGEVVRCCARARLVIAVTLALAGVHAAGAETPEWLEIHSDLLADATSNSSADATALNPSGELVADGERVNVVQLDTELTIQFPREWSFKSRFAGAGIEDGGTDSTFLWREAYLRGQVGPLEFSLGRRIFRWGNGYAFSPAGLLDPLRSPTDPNDRLNQHLGRDLVQLELYRGDHNVSLTYSSPGLFARDRSSDDDLLVLRYNVFANSLDLSLLAGVGPRGNDIAALSASLVPNGRLELHAEFAVKEGTDTLFPRSIEEGTEQTLFGIDYFAPLRSDSSELHWETLLGVNLTFDSGLNLVAEYFHSDDGLSGGEWGRYLGQAQYARTLFDVLDPTAQQSGFAPPRLELLQALATLNRSTLRRDYLFVRLAPRPWRELTGVLLALGNANDRSFVLIPELSLQIRQRLSVFARMTILEGDGASQYGLVPAGRELNLGLRMRL